MTVWNAEESELSGYPLFVILDVFGTYYFAPGFGEYDFYDILFPSRQTRDVAVLPEFTWPSGGGSVEGIIWFAALTNPEMTEMFGEMGIFDFGWSE